MQKRKLKGYVLPTVYLMTMIVMFIGISFYIKGNGNLEGNYLYSLNPLKKTSMSVIAPSEEKKAIAPIRDNAAQITNFYYEREADDAKQQKSLIYYADTYMQNTGVLYASEESFEVLSVLDGTIKAVKEDNILGNVIEIEHENQILSVYYCLSKVNFKAGDLVLQGDVIGISGTSKIETGKANNLLFEVYNKGALMNPETFYSLDLNKEIN